MIPMLNRQMPHQLLMIRPGGFAFNAQTVASNSFQKTADPDARARALSEFDRVIEKLDQHDVAVHVFEDTVGTPDALFLNNWFSTHASGEVVLYPMLAANRRVERRSDLVAWLEANYQVSRVVDFSGYEQQGSFLEGTGSLVLDHVNQVAYANRSPRTSPELVEAWCRHLNFTSCLFSALDAHHQPIYHTNVVMWIGERVAVVCLDAIPEHDQEQVISTLGARHRLVSISFEQMAAFAGNVLEITSRKGDRYFLMSETALQSLVPGQVNELTKHADLLTVNIPTIEQVGGGGIRCMVAGNHLPARI